MDKETVMAFILMFVAFVAFVGLQFINYAPAMEELQFSDGCKIVYAQTGMETDEQCCPYMGMEFCYEVR